MAPKADEKVLDTLAESIAAIFEQAQLSLANHKKNCVALYKLHTKAAGVVQPTKRKGGGAGIGLVGEETFQDAFVDMVNRVLVVKKGPPGADRIVKYVGAYVKFMNEKALEDKSNTASSSSISAMAANNQEDDENPTTRFVSRLLSYLLRGFVAKNKNVRYRCIHIVSEMISHLGEVDEDAYNELRDNLMDRLHDKETLIRAHAVMALSKLVGSENPDEIEEGEQTILQTLLDTISTDPSAEVRRAALVHIPVTPTSLDAILSRTRDIDPVMRKLVYAGVLQVKLGHPRQLSIAQREQVVKDGLGDREPAVRVAAGKLVTSWFDVVVAEGLKTGAAEARSGGKEDGTGWEGDDGGVMKGLIGLLGLFDVVGPGEAVAVDAILSVFTTRPETPDVFLFPDSFWKNMTPESAVLARVFVEHCISNKNEARLESASLPVVTAFAFHIQDAYNALLTVLEDIETAKLLRAGLEEEQGEEDEELEEELAKREVIMSELLRMALKLDYADEIGRRKVFSVVKDMLAHPQLPPGLIERCLDVLKEIMPSERDLIRVIVEIIVELREGDEDAEIADEPPIDDNQSDVSQATIRRDRSARRNKERPELTAEERVQADITDIRCLMLCTAVLERVDSTFEDNSTLEGILGDLIIPSVKRKELAMREKALVSLGLCCLIAKNMALSSFQLFLSQAQNAPAELKVQVLRIILDLLIMYDQEFFGKSEDIATRIIDFLLQTLEAEESPEAQAVLCTGICKLLLAGIITDSKVLTCLALMYISPTTIDNQELRQCLTYFFPVYSYSSASNQNRMQSIFISTFDLAVRMHEDLDDDQEMITPYQFGLLMVDWTNPQKAAEVGADGTHNQESHVNLAVEILVALYDSDRSVEEQKTLCQLLAHLHIESGLDLRSIHKLKILLSYHEDQCPFENTSVDKIFERFKSRFSKTFVNELKEIDPGQYVDDEFRDIYQRIGADVPEEGEGGARRPRSRGKRKAAEDDEDDEEEEEEDQEDEVDEEVDEEMDEEMDEEVNVEVDAELDTEDEAGEAVAATEEADNSDAEEQETVPSDNQSRESTLTPPPKAKREPPKPKGSRQTKSKSKGGKQQKQEESESQGSDEENIPPPPTVSTTPKKKGVKRNYVPASGALNSPANRKRTRVKAPVKSSAKETTPVNSDSDLETPPSPTPKKNARQTRSLRSKGQPKTVKEPIAAPLEQEEESDEAEEVASSLAASSSDFGGYSD